MTADVIFLAVRRRIRRQTSLPHGDAVLEEGVDAYCLRRSRLECPYPEGSVQRAYWICGWTEAASVDCEDD